MSYGPGYRSINLVTEHIPLLKFLEPQFEVGGDYGLVKWPINRGLLVAREGRGQGYLKIEVRRDEQRPSADGRESMTVTSEVVNFYPWIRGTGWFSRLGTWIYSQTQLRIHMWLTRGYLRSLRDVPEEVLRAGEDPHPGPPDT
jgi:hypothetical protein